MHLGLTFGRDLDTAAQRQGLPQDGGADLLGRDASGAGGFGADDGSSLIGLIGPG